MKRYIIAACLLGAVAIAITWQITAPRTHGLILATSTVNRIAVIDSYFTARHMPLARYGSKLVAAADENGIDYRLLPAIAVRESSGGLHACKGNIFGWASCKQTFDTIEDAIETVAFNLGGNATSTRSFYGGKTTREKLQAYNGTVMPSYPDEVIKIMNQIGGDE